MKFYRVYGGRAKPTGSFVTTSKSNNRIDAALKLEWQNTRVYEAEIVVPKGTVLNIGKVAPQKIESTGTILKGGADQILMPRDWPNTWLKNTRIIPSK